MKKKSQKPIHENGIKSPTRNDQNANQNGKIIFNKFDLIQDPVEKAKLENQVEFLVILAANEIRPFREKRHCKYGQSWRLRKNRD